MIFKKLRSLITKENDRKGSLSHMIPEDNNVRTLISFLRNFCTQEENRILYRGYEVQLSIVDTRGISLLVGDEHVSVDYVRTENRGVYEVKEILDNKLQYVWKRNFSIYRALTIDLGIPGDKISYELDYRILKIECRNGTYFKVDVSNVGETSIKLFRDHLKIVY